MAVRKKLGDVLIDSGLIGQEQLNVALERQRVSGGRLGRILIDHGIVDERRLTRALSEQLNVPTVDLDTAQIHEVVRDEVPREMAEKLNLIPVGIRRDEAGSTLYVAMSDPTNLEAIDSLQFRSGKRVSPMIAGEQEIDRAIRRYYYGEQPRSTTPAPMNAVQFSGNDIELEAGPEEIPVVTGTVLDSPSAGTGEMFGPVGGFLGADDADDAMTHPSTPPMSVPPVSTPPMSATPTSTPPMSAAPLSTPPVPAAPLSTPPMSAAPLSTPPMPAAPLSTPPMSAAPLSTPPMPAAPLSTPPMSAPPPSLAHVPLTPPEPSAPSPMSPKPTFNSVDSAPQSAARPLATPSAALPQAPVAATQAPVVQDLEPYEGAGPPSDETQPYAINPYAALDPFGGTSEPAKPPQPALPNPIAGQSDSLNPFASPPPTGPGGSQPVAAAAPAAPLPPAGQPPAPAALPIEQIEMHAPPPPTKSSEPAWADAIGDDDFSFSGPSPVAPPKDAGLSALDPFAAPAATTPAAADAAPKAPEIEINSPPSSAQTPCSNCGKSIVAVARFCPNCGNQRLPVPSAAKLAPTGETLDLTEALELTEVPAISVSPTLSAPSEAPVTPVVPVPAAEQPSASTAPQFPAVPLPSPSAEKAIAIPAPASDAKEDASPAVAVETKATTAEATATGELGAGSGGDAGASPDATAHSVDAMAAPSVSPLAPPARAKSAELQASYAPQQDPAPAGEDDVEFIEAEEVMALDAPSETPPSVLAPPAGVMPNADSDDSAPVQASQATPGHSALQTEGSASEPAFAAEMPPTAIESAASVLAKETSSEGEQLPVAEMSVPNDASVPDSDAGSEDAVPLPAAALAPPVPSSGDALAASDAPVESPPLVAHETDGKEPSDTPSASPTPSLESSVDVAAAESTVPPSVDEARPTPSAPPSMTPLAALPTAGAETADDTDTPDANSLDTNSLDANTLDSSAIDKSAPDTSTLDAEAVDDTNAPSVSALVEAGQPPTDHGDAPLDAQGQTDGDGPQSAEEDREAGLAPDVGAAPTTGVALAAGAAIAAGAAMAAVAALSAEEPASVDAEETPTEPLEDMTDVSEELRPPSQTRRENEMLSMPAEERESGFEDVHVPSFANPRVMIPVEEWGRSAGDEGPDASESSTPLAAASPTHATPLAPLPPPPPGPVGSVGPPPPPPPPPSDPSVAAMPRLPSAAEIIALPGGEDLGLPPPPPPPPISGVVTSAPSLKPTPPATPIVFSSFPPPDDAALVDAFGRERATVTSEASLADDIGAWNATGESPALFPFSMPTLADAASADEVSTLTNATHPPWHDVDPAIVDAIASEAAEVDDPSRWFAVAEAEPPALPVAAPPPPPPPPGLADTWRDAAEKPLYDKRAEVDAEMPERRRRFEVNEAPPEAPAPTVEPKVAYTPLETPAQPNLSLPQTGAAPWAAVPSLPTPASPPVLPAVETPPEAAPPTLASVDTNEGDGKSPPAPPPPSAMSFGLQPPDLAPPALAPMPPLETPQTPAPPPAAAISLAPPLATPTPDGPLASLDDDGKAEDSEDTMMPSPFAASPLDIPTPTSAGLLDAFDAPDLAAPPTPPPTADSAAPVDDNPYKGPSPTMITKMNPAELRKLAERLVKKGALTDDDYQAAKGDPTEDK